MKLIDKGVGEMIHRAGCFPMMMKALQDAENALANCYDVVEYPATNDCHQAKSLTSVRAAILIATKMINSD